MEQNSVYLVDDFNRANFSLYGAQEMDTWAGIRLLARNHEVWRLSISPNKSELQLTDSQGNEILSGIFGKTNKYHDRNYWSALFSYFDPSTAQYGLTNIRDFFQRVSNDFNFDIWWVDTQFYAAAIPKGRSIITRSVNFEPVHVMAEDPSILRYLRVVMKIINEIRVSQSGVVVPISPLDLRRYLRLGIRCASFIPLRQLAFLQAQEEPPSILSDYFVVAGSSFDIRHNRRNLEFIINKVAPILLSLEPKIKIRVFGTRIPSDLKPPNNVEILGFREDYQNQLINSLGAVVPFHGGAGMQSKVFEPLTMGVPLIANPKSLVGYPFKPNIHYLPAANKSEYVAQMISIASDIDLRKRLSTNSTLLSEKLFYDQVLLRTIQEVISAAMN
jgi:hypothetical protein